VESDEIGAGGFLGRLLQDITAEGESWLARATEWQPSRLAFLRVSAGCTTLAQCGPRTAPQQSNRDSGEAWFLSSSATLADTSDGDEKREFGGRWSGCQLPHDGLLQLCQEHGTQSCISIARWVASGSRGHGVWSMEHGALEGACFSRRSMGLVRDDTDGKAGFAPST
jgi:hypothetical protein